MAKRKGMGKGKGKGYKNIIGKDPKVHSQSAKGIKQAQRVPKFITEAPKPMEIKKYTYGEADFLERFSEEAYNEIKDKTDSKIERIEDGFNRETRLKMDDGSEWSYWDSYEDAEKDAREDLQNMWDGDPESLGENLAQQFAYITDTDRRILSGEKADSIIDSLSDDELIEEAGLEDEYESLENKYSEIEDNMRNEQDDTELALLQEELEIIVEQKDKMIKDTKEKLRDEKYDEIYDALDDPVEYFVNEQGMYSLSQLLEQPFISIDYGEASQYVVDNDGLSNLARYDGNWEELRTGGVLIRTD